MLAVSHDNHTPCIIDGMALLQTLAESKFDTCNDLGHVVMQIIQALLTSYLGVTSVTLVFDRYDCEISIKQLECDRHTGRETAPTYVISGRRRVPNYRFFFDKSHKQISIGRVNLCILDRYGYTDPKGTPMAYAGRMFHQWPVGKGC